MPLLNNMAESSNNKRIAKNTIFLYIRMGIIMIVQLYTSRKILEILGVEDYGIWSVIATFVISISFITNPLASATQRFLNIELGKKNEKGAQDIFSESLIIYAFFSIGLFLLFETAGLWFINTKMSIPPEKLYVTNWVYQCSILSFIITILRIPYDATLIAYEKFNFYAIFGIIEVTLRLVIVFSLLLFNSISHLLLYGILTSVVSLILVFVLKIYCERHFWITKFKWLWNKILIKDLLLFSGWSTFGAFSNMTANQGLGILINIFFGVSVNAAMGLANQVGGAINQFVTNFQTAFQPQITKNYACGNNEELTRLILSTSKISFFLLFIIGCPVIFNIRTLLNLWLTEVPEYTTDFCIYIIIIAMIEAVGAPFWMAVQAVGRIMKYQIAISLTLLTTIIFSLLLFKLGWAPQTALMIKTIIAFVCLLIRLIFVRSLISFQIRIFFLKVIIPLFILSMIGCGVFLLLPILVSLPAITYLISSTIVFIIIIGFSGWYLLFSYQQRMSIMVIVKSKLK